jgi:hypothetical protein
MNLMQNTPLLFLFFMAKFRYKKSIHMVYEYLLINLAFCQH